MALEICLVLSRGRISPRSFRHSLPRLSVDNLLPSQVSGVIYARARLRRVMQLKESQKNY